MVMRRPGVIIGISLISAVLYIQEILNNFPVCFVQQSQTAVFHGNLIKCIFKSTAFLQLFRVLTCFQMQYTHTHWLHRHGNTDITLIIIQILIVYRRVPAYASAVYTLRPKTVINNLTAGFIHNTEVPCFRGYRHLVYIISSIWQRIIEHQILFTDSLDGFTQLAYLIIQKHRAHLITVP